MTALNVRQLAELLNDHVAHGRGDDTVYLSLDCDALPDLVRNLLRRHNWAAVCVDWTDDRDAFVVVQANPEADQ